MAEPDLTHDAANAEPVTAPPADRDSLADPAGVAPRSDETRDPPQPPRTADGQRAFGIVQPASPHGPGPRELPGAAQTVAAAAPVGRESPGGDAARHTLHLSMSSGNGSRSGADSQAAAAPRPGHPASAAGTRAEGRSPGHYPGYAHPAREADLPFGAPAAARVSAPPADNPRAREAGAFIDRALRERISGDIEAFLAAFDAALDHDTVESRSGLREATDRLLRAGARTRIELERLEARVPLGSRDKQAGASPLLRAR